MPVWKEDMKNLPEMVGMVLDAYGMDHEESCWYAKHARKWIITHRACEKIGDLAGVSMPEPPQVIHCDLGKDGGQKSAMIALIGWAERMVEGQRVRVWSTGEASPANNRNDHPLAMAEKRLKDRLILKLVFSGIHGDIYSDVEADFREPVSENVATVSAFDEMVEESPPAKATMGRKSKASKHPDQDKIIALLRTLSEEEAKSKDDGYEWALGDTEESWGSLFQSARDFTRGGKALSQGQAKNFKDWLVWAERW